MKKCMTCNREYDRAQWSTLKPTDRNRLITHRSYKNRCIEWRQCECGSTLVKEISCDCSLGSV